MTSGDRCEICRELREEASVAINRHIQASGRRELARLQHDSELLLALDVVVNETASTRAAAVAAFKTHLEAHRGSVPADGQAKGKSA
jgi:hypothetical protein